MTEHAAITAGQIIVTCLRKGSHKDGKGDQWQEKPPSYHIAKGIRHGLTHLMQLMRIVRPDDENHLHKALTRFSMAASIEERQRKNLETNNKNR